MSRAPIRTVIAPETAKRALVELTRTDTLAWLDDHPNHAVDISTHYCADPICEALWKLRDALRERSR